MTTVNTIKAIINKEIIEKRNPNKQEFRLEQVINIIYHTANTHLKMMNRQQKIDKPYLNKKIETIPPMKPEEKINFEKLKKALDNINDFASKENIEITQKIKNVKDSLDSNFDREFLKNSLIDIIKDLYIPILERYKNHEVNDVLAVVFLLPMVFFICLFIPTLIGTACLTASGFSLLSILSTQPKIVISLIIPFIILAITAPPAGIIARSMEKEYQKEKTLLTHYLK